MNFSNHFSSKILLSMVKQIIYHFRKCRKLTIYYKMLKLFCLFFSLKHENVLFDLHILRTKTENLSISIVNVSKKSINEIGIFYLFYYIGVLSKMCCVVLFHIGNFMFTYVPFPSKQTHTYKINK